MKPICVTMASLALVLTVIIESKATAPTLFYPSELQRTQLTIKIGSKTSKRSIYCYGSIPGQGQAREGKIRFTSFTFLVKKLKGTNPSSSQLPIFSKLAKAGRSACQAIPTPTPTATPTPTPASGRNFDSAGNATEAGKILFQIPSHLGANVTSGKAVFESFCVGCHSAKLNKTYPYVDQAIRQSPMLYDEASISREELAHLIAYLNRFRVSS